MLLPLRMDGGIFGEPLRTKLAPSRPDVANEAQLQGYRRRVSRNYFCITACSSKDAAVPYLMKLDEAGEKMACAGGV